jgi:hypothetical protein
MKHLQRVSLSIAGSVVASVVATWALRRLVLAAEQGSGAEPGKQSAVVVVVPIIAGNQLTIGIPRRRLQDGLARSVGDGGAAADER